MASSPREAGVVAKTGHALAEASGFSTYRRGSRRWARVDHPRPRLGRLQQRARLTPAFLEEAALVGKGDSVIDVAAWAEMMA